MSSSKVTAALIVIGNEILSGRTQDTNLSFLGRRLNELGIRLAEARVIADDEDEIVGAVRHLRDRYDYVFTTGGIGPTHDDITTACVAKAFDKPVIRHPEAEARLKAHYRPEDLNEARLKMADTPEGACLIDNPVSAAPGYCIGNVYVMAGVPRIMQAMFENVKETLTGADPVLSRSVWAFVTEGAMAKDLSSIQDSFQDLEIGSYPFAKDQKLGVSIVIRGVDEDRLCAAEQQVAALMRAQGGAPIGGEPKPEGGPP